jgi:hypothetical protein
MKNTTRLLALSAAAFCGAACNAPEISRPTPVPTVVPVESPGPQSSYPSTGPELAIYIMERFPDRLAAGVSHDERVANMEFLRDQMIAAGVCGGMDLARNLKRGVGPHSIDAITWKHDESLDVVDIAAAYDDTGRRLELHWVIVDGPAGYDPGPRPECP